jgi:hypothetical protein
VDWRLSKRWFSQIWLEVSEKSRQLSKPRNLLAPYKNLRYEYGEFNFVFLEIWRIRALFPKKSFEQVAAFFGSPRDENRCSAFLHFLLSFFSLSSYGENFLIAYGTRPISSFLSVLHHCTSKSLNLWYVFVSGIARGASAVCAQKLDLWESMFLARKWVGCLWTKSSLCEKYCVWWSCVQWWCNRMWRMWAWLWQPWPEVKHIHEGYGLLMTLSLTWKRINWRSKESSFSWTTWLAWISWRSTQEEDWKPLSCAASSCMCLTWVVPLTLNLVHVLQLYSDAASRGYEHNHDSNLVYLVAPQWCWQSRIWA